MHFPDIQNEIYEKNNEQLTWWETSTEEHIKQFFRWYITCNKYCVLVLGHLK